MNKKETKKYIESQARASAPVLNDELKCKNCKFRNDSLPTCFCDVFKDWDNRKPNYVLLGKDCPEFKERRNADKDSG